MFRLSMIFLVCFVLSGCMPSGKNKQRAGGTTGGSEGFSPTGTGHTSTGTSTGQSTTTTSSGTVHIFKYTGRKFGRSEETSSFLMENQLTKAGVRWQEKLKDMTDGKTYGTEPGGPTGDIFVFAIDPSQLAISENRAGFCQCTLKRAEKICEPYTYKPSGDPETIRAPSCR